MNKIVIAICVYDRFENIVTWVNCWKVCNTLNAELIIIHNFYGDQKLKKKFKDYCDENKVSYIPRNAPGFDIGAMQDVFKERLHGFPNDWDIILWCTDDVLPMRKDFLSLFINKLTNDVGVACIEISPYHKKHIRTTGFALRKEVAIKLVFPVDPITTKEDCYQFEHRSNNIFYDQIIKMGLRVVMVSIPSLSPLWDMGYLRGLKRQAEHDKMFPKAAVVSNDKVLFICPIFNMYPQIISSLICQTHKNWELLLIHNGPEVNGLDAIVRGYNEPRVKFIINPVQTGNYGHPLRQWALKQDLDADYVVITNADNWHTPTYIEYMLAGFKNNPLAKAVYCSDMVHSYTKWNVISCRLQLGFIDCAGVMVRKDVAVNIGWESMDHSSDWTYFNSIIKKYGNTSFVKVKGCLLTHNVIIFSILVSLITT